MSYSRFTKKNRNATLRQQFYRLTLESLEDRCLLSGGFAQVILASDVPGMAPVTDPNLINPWGLAFSPTGPIWIAENGSNVSDILDGRGQLIPLVVTIPSAVQSSSTPTGTVFNAGPDFVISDGAISAPSRFLFADEDGTIAGWSGKVNPTRAVLAINNSGFGAVYTGLTLATGPSGDSFLYAANFGRGTIDVFDRVFKPIIRPDAFQDSSLPIGFAPFNIQNIGNLLFVSYAQRGEDPGVTQPGPGQGFIDIYHSDGSLVGRFASQGALNSPWGLAVAPAGFGQFAGALLVGNNGDGQINAYDMKSGVFLGELRDENSAPITIPNLWGLIFGNDHAGGNSDTLFFAAGAGDDEHGLFGAIQAPERVGSDTAGSGVFDNHGPGEPGDYPLPPNSGPLIRAIREDQILPISDLLPLRESSLVLVPTLSNSYQPVLNVEMAVPGGSVPTDSSVGSFLVTEIASSTTDLKSSEEGSRSRSVVGTGTPLLFAFHESDFARQVAKVQGHGNKAVFASPNLALADPNFELEPLPSDFSGDRLGQVSKNLSNGRAIPSEVNQILGTPPDGRIASTEDKVGKASLGESNKGDVWKSIFRFVFAFTIPIIWSYCLIAPRSRHGRDSIDWHGFKA
jgi:uncharacterized protein (TIGR03118 family)